MNEEKEEQNRKDILYNLLEIIGGISDLEYQKRVWFRGEGPEVDDFTETSCFFSSYMRMIEDELEKYHFTAEQNAALLNFQNNFQHFLRRHSWAEDFFDEEDDDPEWAMVRKQASGVLKVFKHVRVGFQGRGYG